MSGDTQGIIHRLMLFTVRVLRVVLGDHTPSIHIHTQTHTRLPDCDRQVKWGLVAVLRHLCQPLAVRGHGSEVALSWG